METQKDLIPEWDKKFEVAVPEIDFQHKYFLELIKRFYNLSKSGIRKEHLSNYLKELRLYGSFHFASEENIMKMYNYPYFEEHRQQHIDLIEELTNKSGLFELGEIELEELIAFLIDWFVDHTQGEDIKLSQFLSNN